MKKILLYIIIVCCTSSVLAQLQERLTSFTTRLDQLQQLLSLGAAPISNLPPIITAFELDQLDAAQKKHSDDLMIELITNISEVEFYSLLSMKQFITEALQHLRTNVLFFQRAAVDRLLDEQEGLLAKLHTLYSPNPAQNLDNFLLQAYDELRKQETSIFYTVLSDLLHDCFFNPQELKSEPIITALLQLSASAIVSQREKPSGVSPEQQKKSDTVFIDLFKSYQENLQSHRTVGLYELGYELNRLRLLPDFLKFTEYMLYPTDKSKIEKSIIPFIPFVRNISQFLATKTSFAASQQLSIQARRFLFDENLWRTTINNDLWKPAFEFEFARNRPIIAKISLENFIVQELPKIKSLTQLGQFFKQLEDNYTAELETHLGKLEEIRDIILTRLLKVNAQEIINFLHNITHQNAPAPFITFLETIQDDAVLINIVRDALTESELETKDFGKELLEKTTHYQSIQKELISLYRTPLSVFLTIQNEFKNREMKYILDTQQFYFKIKPCGMLIRLFEFFIREVHINVTAATNNWHMLHQSLECMNHPQLCLSKDGRYFKLYQTIYNAFYPKEKKKSAILERIEQGKAATTQLAPVLFNFYVENNTLKSFSFLPSLTVYKDAEDPYLWGIYDKKLNNVIAAINNKNVEQIIMQVREFVEQTEIIPTGQEPFITFIKNLEKALDDTINRLAI